MKLFVYSKIPLLKISIIDILKNDNTILFSDVKKEDIECIDDLKNIFDKKGDILIAVINSEEDFKNILDIKHKSNIKMVAIDFLNSSNIKSILLDNNIEGYLTYISEATDILLAIFQVNRGKKYYDTDIYINKKNKFEEKLTLRENEILKLVALGKRNREIANTLYISENTVKKHISNIFYKLGLNDRVEAISYAYNMMILS